MYRGGGGRGGSYFNRGRGRGAGGGGQNWGYGGGQGYGNQNFGGSAQGFTLKITGYDGNRTTSKDLISFLNSHAQFTYIKGTYTWGPQEAFMSVGTRQEVSSLLLCTGQRFLGKPITVSEEYGDGGGGGPSRGGYTPPRGSYTGGHATQQNYGGNFSPPSDDEIKQFVLSQSSQINPQNPCLDMSSLSMRPEFQNKNVNLNQERFTLRLLAAIFQRCQGCTTVDFSSNGIRTLQYLGQMNTYCPSLINVCFAGNEINNFREMDHLKHIQFRELIFSGNPIADSPQYRREMLGKFPALQYLDGEPCQVPLPPICGSYVDSANTKTWAEQFLQKYYGIFDTNRQQLFNAYADNASFSLTVDPNSMSKGTPQQQQLMRKFITSSRNFYKVQDIERRTNLLAATPLEVLNALVALPASQHRLDQMTIDAAIVPNVSDSPLLMITVLGEFIEGQSNQEVCFRRVFILVQADQVHQQAGWQVVVRNDQLHLWIRGPNEPKPRPSTPPMSPAAQGHASPAPATNPQEEMVRQLMAQTRAPQKICIDALGQNKWDYQQTITAMGQTFEQYAMQLSAATGSTPNIAKEMLAAAAWDPNKALEYLNTMKATGARPPGI